LIRTYLDSGVLIAASRSRSKSSELAISILEDQNREFISSDYLRLEIVPKATYFRSTAEFKLYEEFLAKATVLPGNSDHFDLAYILACQYGLAAMDSLHITVAVETFCDEFITTERPTSPLFRVPGIRILTLSPPLTR